MRIVSAALLAHSDLWLMLTYFVENFKKDFSGLKNSLLKMKRFLSNFLDALHVMEIQAPAIDTYNIMMEQFLQEIDGELQFVYPDTYAGAYIDDYGMLVIQLMNAGDEAFYTGDRITAVAHTAPVNTRVMGAGQRTGFWMGTVHAVDRTIQSTQGLTLVIAGNPRPDHGDSGGTIWFLNGGRSTFVVVLQGGHQWEFAFTPFSWISGNFAPRTH